MDVNSLINIIQKRGNVTQFKRDPIKQEDLDQILEAARWAPSAGNAQPWELIVIRDSDTKKEIAKIHADAVSSSEEPEELSDSYLDPSILIGVCIDTRIKEKYPDLFCKAFLVYASIGTLIQNMWLAVSSLGLGMGMGSQPLSAQDELKELLDLPDYFWVPEIIQIGYKAEETVESKRREVQKFTHKEKLDRSKIR